MHSNYKKLGKYIQPVNIRNTELKVETLLGVSIKKVLMPSIANTVGTNMKTYKIIKRNQFAYGPVTSRNGDKISVALLQDYDEAIVSQAYTVFEVKNENELHPEYLMMWMRRPEFDRYARFKSHGSAREVFDWDEMCETELPIPNIEKQRAFVKEYNTIVNRIELNEQLNQKLEETAQALYKHWFVDFEFPNVDGKPYKSPGGKLVYNAELDKDIPEGWEVDVLSKICTITSSKRIFEREYRKEGIPFFRAGEIRLKKEGVPLKEVLFISEERYNEIVEKFGQPQEGDILMTAVGSLLGDSYLVQPEKFYFKDGNVIWLKDFAISNINVLIYSYLQSDLFEEFLDEIRIGSGQSAITIKGLGEKYFAVPHKDILKKYSDNVYTLCKTIAIKNKQNSFNHELKELLLSKMTKVETEKELN